jgi:phosphatidylinositol glycan class U
LEKNVGVFNLNQIFNYVFLKFYVFLPKYFPNRFSGREVIAAGILAVATQLTLYPVVLLPALVLRGRHWAAVMFATVFAVIFALNWQLESSGQFLTATYGFIVAVPDLRPNVGIFWYFFIQVLYHYDGYIHDYPSP